MVQAGEGKNKYVCGEEEGHGEALIWLRPVFRQKSIFVAFFRGMECGLHRGGG